MEVNIRTYQSIYSVKDEAFDIEALSSYELNLLVTHKEFSFFVFDTKSQRALYLEHYLFVDVFTTNAYTVEALLLLPIIPIYLCYFQSPQQKRE